MKHQTDKQRAVAHERATWRAFDRHSDECFECHAALRIGKVATRGCDLGRTAWDEWLIAGERLRSIPEKAR